MIRANQRLLKQGAQLHAPPFVRISVPTVVLATVCMLIGNFILAAAVVLVSRSIGVRFDPFADYAAFLPGEAWDHVDAAGFECDLSYNDDLSLKSCSARPASGIFSQITFTRHYDDIVDGVVFTPRENALTLGDVALAFGAQQGRHSPRNRWIIDGARAVVWMDLGSRSYFQPVRTLYLYYRPVVGLDQDY